MRELRAKLNLMAEDLKLVPFGTGSYSVLHGEYRPGGDRHGRERGLRHTPMTDREGESLEKPLIGEIDCVVAKDGQPVLIDWKTAACRWSQSKADTNLQATAYTYAYRRLRQFGLVGFRFDVLVENKTPVLQQLETRREGDDVYRFVELVKRAERIVEYGLYYPNESGFACKGCQFKAACRNWHRQVA